LIADRNLYLKADNHSQSFFSDQGLEAFSYLKQGRTCKLSYFQAPESVFEEPESMLLWGCWAYEAALRSNTQKNKK